MKIKQNFFRIVCDMCSLYKSYVLRACVFYIQIAFCFGPQKVQMKANRRLRPFIHILKAILARESMLFSSNAKIAQFSRQSRAQNFAAEMFTLSFMRKPGKRIAFCFASSTAACTMVTASFWAENGIAFEAERENYGFNRTQYAWQIYISILN